MRSTLAAAALAAADLALPSLLTRNTMTSTPPDTVVAAFDFATGEKTGKQYGKNSDQRAEWVRATAGTQRELVAAVGGDSERIFNGILAAKRAFAARAPAPQVPTAAPAKPASPTPAR